MPMYADVYGVGLVSVLLAACAALPVQPTGTAADETVHELGQSMGKFSTIAARAIAHAACTWYIIA